MQRIAMVINVKPEKLDEYKRLHAAAWPDVLAAMQGHVLAEAQIVGTYQKAG